MMKVIRTTGTNDYFKSLVRELDLELHATYGLIQAQYDKLNTTENINQVVVGYIDDNTVACGCFKMFDQNTVELKRMFVKVEERGSGIASMIIIDLEKWAIEMGFSKVVLETGIKQEAAMRFYTKHGYSKISNYGPYIENPNSICMSKPLIK